MLADANRWASAFSAWWSWISGSSLSPFRRSLLRAVIDCSLIGLSFLLIPFTQGKRGFHDLSSGTYVIRIRPPLQRELLIAVTALDLHGRSRERRCRETATPHQRKYLRSFYLPSTSMEPTLLRGDYYITADTRWARTAEPRRGDIVIYESPKEEGRLLIKRIMGLPGERISLRDRVTIYQRCAIARRPRRLSRASTFLDEYRAVGNSAGPLFRPRRQPRQ